MQPDKSLANTPFTNHFCWQSFCVASLQSQQQRTIFLHKRATNQLINRRVVADFMHSKQVTWRVQFPQRRC